MKEEKNSPIYLRPRFRIELNKSKTDLLNRFYSEFKRKNCKFSGKIIADHVIIDIPQKENHFWSPQLHLEIEAIDKGLFGPKPQVWTLFIFLHATVAFTFISVLIYAYTKWVSKEGITLSICVLIYLAIFWVVMYFLGQLGKKQVTPKWRTCIIL